MQGGKNRFSRIRRGNLTGTIAPLKLHRRGEARRKKKKRERKRKRDGEEGGRREEGGRERGTLAKYTVAEFQSPLYRDTGSDTGSLFVAKRTKRKRYHGASCRDIEKRSARRRSTRRRHKNVQRIRRLRGSHERQKEGGGGGIEEEEEEEEEKTEEGKEGREEGEEEAGKQSWRRAHLHKQRRNARLPRPSGRATNVRGERPAQTFFFWLPRPASMISSLPFHSKRSRETERALA